MGLDTSHDCWHGAYSAFMQWRKEIAKAAGLPPLELMEGFFVPDRADCNPFYVPDYPLLQMWIGKRIAAEMPIKWDCLKPSPLHELLHHSDCDGEIPWQRCGPIADALEAVLPNMPKGEAGGHIGDWKKKTQQFIDGLRLAASKEENVDFH